ncbi:MAG: 50S ribosomal protein L29 [Actinobacteria bacterium]|nr:MAG: 50S ribosomal protein L29 [Actinomycetota bacterium]
MAELRELPDEQLIERLESHKEELFNLRFQLATGQLDNPMRIKDVRHDVSRILTVLRERQPEQEVEEELARADAEALAQSRQAQAAGTKRGEPLDVMLEPGAEVAEADAELEEQQTGKRTRRRRGSKKEASGND